MKICAIICEYNPLHNGHKYLIENAKKQFDSVLCVMSGSFTQRGDIAVLDKFTRAEHAIKSGADCVIQLPVSFSVTPAEIFAKGAVKLLTSIPDVRALTFGCETDDDGALVKNAEILLKEDGAFKKLLKKGLDGGESYQKSFQNALNLCGGDGKILDGSNNILALEYTKALIEINADVRICPVKRTGNFNDTEIDTVSPSSRAIRENILSEKVKNCVPDYVYTDIKKGADIKDLQRLYDSLLRYSLIKNSAESMRGLFGCSEGLENKLKKCAENCFSAEDIIRECTSKRYSSSRIRRILCANMLGIYENESKKYLQSPLYIKPLAVKKDCADEMLAALSRSPYPLVIRKNDARYLESEAQSCLEKDDFANNIYNMIYGVNFYNYTFRIV